MGGGNQRGECCADATPEKVPIHASGRLIAADHDKTSLGCFMRFLVVKSVVSRSVGGNCRPLIARHACRSFPNHPFVREAMIPAWASFVASILRKFACVSHDKGKVIGPL